MNNLLWPPLLKAGDAVCLIAPSRAVNNDEISSCKNWLLSKGLSVIEGPNLFAKWHQYAGTHSQRLDDLNWALTHPQSKAIVLARGGFGMAHLVDELKPVSFSNSKWVIGFSDATMLGIVLNRFGLPFVHGPVARTWPKTQPSDIEALGTLLFSGKSDLVFGGNSKPFSAIQAPVVGGNLTLITHSLGTAHSFRMPQGGILFLEEVGEYHYHIDRMFNQLFRAGILQKASAVILGAFSDLKDTESDFGIGIIPMLRHFVGDNIPIISGFPAGHEDRNFPLVLGAQYVLSSNATGVSLKIKTAEVGTPAA